MPALPFTKIAKSTPPKRWTSRVTQLESQNPFFFWKMYHFGRFRRRNTRSEFARDIMWQLGSRPRLAKLRFFIPPQHSNHIYPGYSITIYTSCVSAGGLMDERKLPPFRALVTRLVTNRKSLQKILQETQKSQLAGQRCPEKLLAHVESSSVRCISWDKFFLLITMITRLSCFFPPPSVIPR
jgi:hypothetical protein